MFWYTPLLRNVLVKSRTNNKTCDIKKIPNESRGLRLDLALAFQDCAVSDLAYRNPPIPLLPSHFNCVAGESSSALGRLVASIRAGHMQGSY